MTSPEANAVILKFANTLDAEAWGRRYIAGEVPSRVPYGLEHLSEFGFEIAHQRVEPRHSLFARAFHRLSGFPLHSVVTDSPRPSAGDTVVCWDEQTSVPHLLSSRHIGPVATGVIWLTDFREPKASRILARRALARASLVWALSSAQIPILRQEFGVAECRLRHLLFGIDEEFFRPADSGMENTPGLVGSVGNDRGRDFSTLISAVTIARQYVPSIQALRS